MNSWYGAYREKAYTHEAETHARNVRCDESQYLQHTQTTTRAPSEPLAAVPP